MKHLPGVLLLLIALPCLCFGQMLGTYLVAGLTSNHFGMHLDQYTPHSTIPSLYHYGQDAALNAAFAGGAGIRLADIGDKMKGRLDLELMVEYYGADFRVNYYESTATGSIDRISTVPMTGYGLTPRINWSVVVDEVFEPFVGLGLTYQMLDIDGITETAIAPDLMAGMRLRIWQNCKARFHFETAPLGEIDLIESSPIGPSVSGETDQSTYIYTFEPGMTTVFVGLEFSICINCQ